jgi:hypothetical protein
MRYNDDEKGQTDATNSTGKSFCGPKVITMKRFKKLNSCRKTVPKNFIKINNIIFP